MSDTERTCGDSGGVNASGEPCGTSLGLSEVNGRCLSHDPLRRDVAKAVRAAGGRARARADVKRKAALPENIPKVKPDSLENVATWLQWVAFAAASGEIDGRTAGEVTRALKELRPVLEKLELGARLEAVEGELKARKAGAK